MKSLKVLKMEKTSGLWYEGGRGVTFFGAEGAKKFAARHGISVVQVSTRQAWHLSEKPLVQMICPSKYHSIAEPRASRSAR